MTQQASLFTPVIIDCNTKNDTREISEGLSEGLKRRIIIFQSVSHFLFVTSFAFDIYVEDILSIQLNFDRLSNERQITQPYSLV